MTLPCAKEGPHHPRFFGIYAVYRQRCGWHAYFLCGDLYRDCHAHLTRYRITNLENPGKLPLVLIEVQTGGYLGEDDIKRHNDIYARD